MAISKPVVVGDRSFPSKTKALEEIRRIWNVYDVGEPVTDPEDEDFLYNLVLMRPDPEEKLGPGIDYFKVVNPRDSGAWVRDNVRAVAIVWVDGTEVEFSAPKSLDAPQTPFQRLTSALANEAQDITGRVREAAFEAGPVICPLTGTIMEDRSEAETRHLNPPLKDLVSQFLLETGLSVDEIELENLQTPDILESERAIRGLRVKDPSVRAQWLEFQREHVSGLAVVHRSAPRR
ncbi:DCL family protein [Sinomonas sp. P47F7]|uniref:DCL family protein n=1 Tax=Sinomonas sp. P47F7 TaxID=3410987 RepID=UPI003BF4C315